MLAAPISVVVSSSETNSVVDSSVVLSSSFLSEKPFIPKRATTRIES